MSHAAGLENVLIKLQLSKVHDYKNDHLLSHPVLVKSGELPLILLILLEALCYFSLSLALPSPGSWPLSPLGPSTSYPSLLLVLSILRPSIKINQ